jgi:hypothetical protein
VAPVPLYNTFEEVFQFAEIFKRAIKPRRLTTLGGLTPRDKP